MKLYLVVIVLLHPCAISFAIEPPSAVALLRGVELVRTAEDSVTAKVDYGYSTNAGVTEISFEIAQDGDRRRFEVTNAEGKSNVVVIKDGDEFLGYRRKPQEDVQIYDLQRAKGVRGDRCFDPRAIGLTDILFVDTTVSDCLRYREHENPRVVGEETINGVSVWKVTTRRDASGSISEYWIEEPSFRLHRRTVQTTGMSVDIRSEFDSADSLTPFPSVVHATRTVGSRTDKTIFKIRELKVGVDVDPKLFTLASMNLPIDTPAVDYQLSKRIGYWNGEGLSEHPVGGQVAELAAPNAVQNWVPRLLLIALSTILIFAIVRWKMRRDEKA